MTRGSIRFAVAGRGADTAVSGTVHCDDGRSFPFDGWLALMSILHELDADRRVPVQEPA